MILSYLMSFLYARSLLLKQGFVSKHPGCWLVWEPGSWHVPTAQNNAATMVPTRAAPTEPQPGDALCFELKPLVGKALLRVGRDLKSEIAINDATVSRDHLLLHPVEGGGWLAQPAAADRRVLLSGRALAADERAPLTAGDALELGAARLSYYDPQAFLVRLSART